LVLRQTSVYQRFIFVHHRGSKHCSATERQSESCNLGYDKIKNKTGTGENCVVRIFTKYSKNYKPNREEWALHIAGIGDMTNVTKVWSGKIKEIIRDIKMAFLDSSHQD
jgi:hypothetical protein